MLHQVLQQRVVVAHDACARRRHVCNLPQRGRVLLCCRRQQLRLCNSRGAFTRGKLCSMFAIMGTSDDRPLMLSSLADYLSVSGAAQQRSSLVVIQARLVRHALQQGRRFAVAPSLLIPRSQLVGAVPSPFSSLWRLPKHLHLWAQHSM